MIKIVKEEIEIDESFVSKLNEIYVHNLGKKIKLSKLENYIKENEYLYPNHTYL